MIFWSNAEFRRKQAVVLQHRLAGLAQLRGLGKKPRREKKPKRLNDELNNAAEVGNWKEAQSIYEGLKAKDELPTDMQIRRVYFNTVLKAFANAGNFEGAKMWFEQGKQAGIVANSKGLGKLLEAAVKGSHIEEIQRLSSQCTKQPVEVWNMFVDAYAKLGRAADAEQVIDRMESKQVDPNVVTYTTLIDAHSKARRPTEALEVLRKMRKANMTPTVVTYGALISGLAQHGLVEESMNLLKEMASLKVPPNVICMNAVINAHAVAARTKPSMWQGAIAVLEDMQSRALEPTQRTLGSVIKAACNANSREVAIDMLHNMERRHRIAPDVAEFTMVMRSCVEGRQLQTVKTIFEEMQRHGVRANEMSYCTLIRACAEGGDPELAAEYLRQMKDKDGLQPNVVAYTGVIQAYAHSKNHQKALEWLQLMLDARIEVDAIPFHKVARACLHSTPTKDDVIEAVLRLMSTHGIPLSEEMSCELKRHKHFGRRFRVLQSQLQLAEGLSGQAIRRHTNNVRRLPLRREGMLLPEVVDGRTATRPSQSNHIAQTSKRERKQVERALGVPFV